jgi:hypothetical protein
MASCHGFITGLLLTTSTELFAGLQTFAAHHLVCWWQQWLPMGGLMMVCASSCMLTDAHQRGRTLQAA